ncbi:MAG: dihydrolipoyl dehydrogenase [Candidatus Tantalella remota]|nr:dihydrolipoyl dehydrogenase [Candidatus Tantalella remota]
MSKKYDYIVIGSGPAGHVSAVKVAQGGLKVAVIEKDLEMFGGVCLNEGCIPAKSLYNSAEILYLAGKHADLCGLELKSSGVRMSDFVKRSRTASAQLLQGLSFIFKKNKVDLINGEVRFTSEKDIQVTDADGKTYTMTADKYLIAAGSEPKALKEVPFDGKTIISSSQAIRLESVPGKILIIGGGAIGTEFASFFNILGSEVTIAEVEDAILPTEDRDVSRRLATIFKQQGISLLTSSRVTGAKVSSDGAVVTIKSGDKDVKEKYDIVIVSVGRVPSTRELGLDLAGVSVDEKGFVPVDEKMMTNVKNIYAAGDVVSSPMLAHVASAEGEIAAGAVSGSKVDRIDPGAIPNAVYTRVQVASVGMTEEQVKDKGLNYSAGKEFFKANGKAVVTSETDGFIKVLAESDSHKILGAHIVGHNATDLIHEFVVAKRKGLTVDDIADTVHAHPTFSESAAEACRAVFGKPLHG